MSASGRSNSGNVARGSDDSGGNGWTSSSIFLEQSLEREFIPFFLQMKVRVCGGGGLFPSYRAQDGSRGERAHLRPKTLKPNIIIVKIRSTKEGLREWGSKGERAH